MTDLLFGALQVLVSQVAVLLFFAQRTSILPAICSVSTPCLSQIADKRSSMYSRRSFDNLFDLHHLY